MYDFAEGKAPWRNYRERIQSVVIDAGVTSIGQNAFYGCTNLTDVNYGGTKAQWKAMEIGSGNEYLLNAVVYATDGTIVAYGTCGDNLTWELDGEGTLTISGTGTMYSFAENGAPWYGYSSAIQNVALGENVTSIGDYAFNGFSIPTSITIPTSVTTIGEGAFNGCTGLKDVYYGDTKAQWNKISIGTGNECLTNASLHTVTPSGACGENLTWVLNDDGTLIITGTGPMDNFAEGNAPWYAYRDTIKKVLIKNGATNIGEYAFYGCSNLTDITIPNSVTVIGTAAFADCTSLADVTCGATMVQWQDVTVGENNECLKNATFHFTIVREPIEVELPEWV